MADIGVFGDIINAQNVLFQKGNDEYIQLHNIRLIDESIIDRAHLRGGAKDTPTFSLIEIVADISVDKATYDSFRSMRQLTTRGALPTASYKIVAQAPSGAAKDFTETGTFIVRRMESVAPEQGNYNTNIILRLNNDGKLSES